jgi:hypothetical protein
VTARLATGASFVVLSIAALTVAAWLVQPRSGLFGLANLLGAHLVLACLHDDQRRCQCIVTAGLDLADR